MAIDINFERMISRGMAKSISDELDMAGVKLSVNTVAGIMIVPGIITFLLSTILIYVFLISNAFISVAAGIIAWGSVIAGVYLWLEYRIDQRKTKIEAMLPDYLQIVAANLRSGISLERAMLLAARPEFSFLSDEVKELNRRVFGGQTLEASLQEFASRYRSNQLSHAIRMMNEALRYGGAMADLVIQISKDMRDQQVIQKEVAGQLLLYTIFVAFAGIIAAPVLYGLTAQMITVTDQVWNGILAANPAGLQGVGVSFFKPTPPQITPDEYQLFAYLAILIITGFASLIISAISTGSIIKGLRFVPLGMIVGVLIFIVVRHVMASIFVNIGSI